MSKPERNKELIEAYKNRGTKTAIQVAKDFKITKTRMYQILNDYGIRKVRRVNHG